MRTTSHSQAVVGLILAGGLSRRMGGGDKALRLLAGQPMLAHVIERLRPQVDSLVLNANGDPSRFAPFGLPVVADTIPDFAGPLAGVLAGMQWARHYAPEARWIVSAAADTPFFPADLVARFLAAGSGYERRIVLAASADGTHPVFGLWPIALADDLERALTAGIRKILDWTDTHETLLVTFDHVTVGRQRIDPFFNANRPEDVAKAESLLTGRARRLVGIAGWKNSGKTTLATRLIAEMTLRGYRVSSLKHAHHDFQVDTADTDSARHRRAGAREVAIVSPERWALIGELRGALEPTLDDMVAKLAPCDLVVVEGFKGASIPKVEARRSAAAKHTPLSPADRHVIAIAADHAVPNAAVPVLALDDIVGIADLVERNLGLKRA